MTEIKIKKKSIPKVLKDLCWSKYVGDNVGKTNCMCCETNEIKMNDFHCGHIIAESNGGTTTVDNLLPICKACNLSMRTENLNEFKIRCGFHRVEITQKSQDDQVVTWLPSMGSSGSIRPKYIKLPLNTPLLYLAEGILRNRGYIYNIERSIYELK